MTDGEPRASNGAATNVNARNNIITPVSTAASRPTAPKGDSFPGYLTCVISGEPPGQGVYYVVGVASGGGVAGDGGVVILRHDDGVALQC